MTNGKERTYKTKWVFGVITSASKTARHKYMGIYYRGKNYKIHRLVCEAFHGSSHFDGAVVIHLNEDATDNRPENLKWGTQKENLNMPKIKAYHRSRTGDNSPTRKHKARLEAGRV